MARVTVEDCVDRIPNRFELVLCAAQRAREIASGAALTLDKDNDKNPVVALREVAAETVKPDELKESLLKGLQRLHESNDADDDVIDFESTAEEDAIAAGVLSQQNEPPQPAPRRRPEPEYEDDGADAA